MDRREGTGGVKAGRRAGGGVCVSVEWGREEWGGYAASVPALNDSPGQPAPRPHMLAGERGRHAGEPRLTGGGGGGRGGIREVELIRMETERDCQSGKLAV